MYHDRKEVITMSFKDFSFAQFDSQAALSLGLTAGIAEGGVHSNSSCGPITNSACTSHDPSGGGHCQSIQSSGCTSHRR